MIYKEKINRSQGPDSLNSLREFLKIYKMTEAFYLHNLIFKMHIIPQKDNKSHNLTEVKFYKKRENRTKQPNIYKNRKLQKSLEYAENSINKKKGYFWRKLPPNEPQKEKLYIMHNQRHIIAT